MVFGVILYFILVTAVLALLFLAPVREWTWQCMLRAVAGSRAFASSAATTSHSRLAHAAGAVDSHGMRAAQWMYQHRKRVLVSAAALAGAPLLAYALRGMQQLDGFDHTATHRINEHVAALLHGELLVPPPPLPPEMFATQEVEHARPLIAHASRQWELLDEEFRHRMLVVFKVMRETHGYEMVLLEGYRSAQRQTELASLGPHVTHAGAFQSYHQFGLAADCAFIRNGRIVVSEADPWAARGYALYGEVARSVGLTWGGGWRTIKDLGHVELRRAGVLSRGAGMAPSTVHAH